MFSYEIQQAHQADLHREAEQWRLAHRAATERRAQRRTAARRAAARTDTEGSGSSHRAHPTGLDRFRRALHPHSAA